MSLKLILKRTDLTQILDSLRIKLVLTKTPYENLCKSNTEKLPKISFLHIAISTLRQEPYSFVWSVTIQRNEITLHLLQYFKLLFHSKIFCNNFYHKVGSISRMSSKLYCHTRIRISKIMQPMHRIEILVRTINSSDHITYMIAILQLRQWPRQHYPTIAFTTLQWSQIRNAIDSMATSGHNLPQRTI
jgi:hypothetical protein